VLIGVNTFKGEGAEGLNFAVAIDEVRKFLARGGNRLAPGSEMSSRNESCKKKELSRFRNKTNDATVIAYDIKCNGKINADYIIPDEKTEAIMLTMDRNDDGRPDVIYFDFKRQGKWELSFWDENFDGQWTLVGYHPDGNLKPSSFESYSKFQSRQANR